MQQLGLPGGLRGALCEPQSLGLTVNQRCFYALWSLRNAFYAQWSINIVFHAVRSITKFSMLKERLSTVAALSDSSAVVDGSFHRTGLQVWGQYSKLDGDCTELFEVSDWVDEGDCSTSCGGGLQSQVKNINVLPQYGGALCPSLMNRHEPCNTDPCPIDCEYEAWSGWSICGASCGEGTEERHRGEYISAEHGGAACAGDASDHPPQPTPTSTFLKAGESAFHTLY